MFVAAKPDLASLKARVNEIDIDKIKTIPVDLSKLSNVIDNDVVKKIVFDKLVGKVSSIKVSSAILTNKILKKRLTMLIKKYLVLV